MSRPPTILTPRELDVLELVSQGYTNREIGDRLTITAETVRNHMQHILRKLGTPSRAAAASLALRQGLID